MTSPQFDCPELAQLQKFRAVADKAKADADRWPAYLAEARADLATAEQSFADTLAPAEAKAVAEASARVRELVAVCDVYDRTGGGNAHRRKALSSPEVFAVLTRGFDRRLDELGKVKKAAQRSVALAHADAIDAGHNPLLLATVPGVRAAQDVLRVIDDAAQAALVARNYTAARGVNCTPVSFDSLAGLLASPLPVVASAA